MSDIIQLKITLRDTKPPIWRRVLVPKAMSFLMLHYIIQTVMEWEDAHLFEFRINGERLTKCYPTVGNCDDPDVIEADTVMLEDRLTRPKMKFTYVYDFGDYWEHQILVEKFLPYDPSTIYPVCIKGKLNTPPEDSGGVGGYYEMLTAFYDKDHPDHMLATEWLGEAFDEKDFNKDAINKRLAEMGGYPLK